MTHGAIILCGGQSTRMGCDKAMLPFGPGEVMLQRVGRLVGEVVGRSRIVVVAAVGQELPTLPDEVQIARDGQPDRGPMEGLAAGLRVLQGRADAAFVTSCDVPLLQSAFVRRLFALLDESQAKLHAAGEMEIVVPREDRFHHPLSAVYRMSVLPVAEELLAAGRLRLRFLFENCRTLEVPIEEFRNVNVDPKLDSLANCNRPEDYAAALARCGFSD